MAVSPLDDPALRSQFAAGPIRDLFEHEATLQRYLDVEAALARAQAFLGLIPGEAAEAISQAARVEHLDLERYADDVATKGFPIAPLVDQLTGLTAGGFGEWAHWGATTQDIVDTARVLQVRDALVVVDDRLRTIRRHLTRLADEHRATPMAGRSMLQHAVPISFGYKAAVWASMVDRLLDRLPELRSRVLVAQLGGAAGNLSALGEKGAAVRAAFGRELELADPGITWHTARDRVADTVYFLALTCATLAKIGFDIVLLAQTDVAEVAESLAAGAGGSSTMPHKRNPIRSQVLMMAARVTRQLATSTLETMVNDHERGSGVWLTEWWSVPEAFAVCGGALEHAVELTEHLAVDPEQMSRNLGMSRGLMMSEAVMMALAPKIGRHAAHALMETVTRSAAASGADLRSTLLSDAAVMEHLSADDVDRALDPANYLGATSAMIDWVLDR